MKNNSFTNRAIVNCKVFSFNKNWNILAIKKTTFMLVILMLLSFSIFLVAGKNLTTTSTNQTYQLSSYNADENNYSEPTNQTNKTKITEEKSKNETLLVSIDKVINETLKIEEKTENLTKLNKTFAQQNLTSSNNLTQLNLTQKKQESNNSEEIKTENKNDKPKTRSSVIKKSTISKAVNKSSDKKNEVNQTKEKIKLICYKNSEKSFEGKVDKNIDCHQIEKKEIESGDKKRVIIKSDKHIEDSIIIYTDIPEIPKNKKSAVKIYWKNNNNKEITQINFYDKNNNGLFDRISWVVPHLSEQIFEIIINFTTHTLSSEIEINVTSPKQGEVVRNPIEFKIDINYTNLSNLNCHLFIDGKYPETVNFSVENKSIIWPHDLKDGPHNWIVECIDINTSNKKAVNGTFIINESYCVQLNNKIYLLNDTEEIKINISSKNNANVTIELTNPDNTIHKLVSNEQISSPYIINRSLITKRGLYKVNISFNNLKKPYSIIKNFSVVELQLTLNNNEITTNEEINITLAIYSPIEPISSATLYFGDGDEKTFNNIGSTDFTKTIAHSYEEPGDYTLNLTANIDERWFTIKKNGIHVNSSENGRDDEDPEIELISPEDNAVIHTQEIFFSYRATDNVKVANCTFELYNNSGPFGSLEYSQTNTNISNNEIITIRLSQFEEAEYSWRVECCDNSSNCAAKIRDFTISLNTSLLMDNLTYEHQEEVEEAISNLEEFLIKKESYDLEKLEVLDDLGISEDLTYFQKRLPQIKIDLSNNLKYLTNESLREERKKEILEEFFEIKEKIPLDVSIVDKKEFVKNSVPANLEGIIKQYLEEKNIYKRNLKSLINLNRELQKNIKVRTKVRQVKIEYPNETKEITLVTKKIELKNNTDETILESIPKDIDEEIVFLTENEAIKENELYSVLPENLKDGKLIYYFEGFIDPEEVEKTETILFKDTSQKFGITGFSVYLENLSHIGNKYSIAVIILFLIILVPILVKRIKIKKWKKDENVNKIFELKKQIKKFLENGEIENAKDKYNQIKESYSLIPEKCKQYLFKDLKKIKIAIERKEIAEWIEEYFKAKNQKRIDDATIIYQKIRQKYKELPEKYKEEVYNKIFKRNSYEL